jgi:hypothetical protein
VKSAGLTHRGTNLYELARAMGTSVEQVDSTYAHPLPDSIDRIRTKLDDHVGRLGTKWAPKAESGE